MAKKLIYLDHAAATPVDDRVLRAMEPFWQKEFANPSSIYSLGNATRLAVDDARESIAKILGALGSEIIFTSGGTEANNLAILGAACGATPHPHPNPLPQGERGNHRRHILVSAIEHHSVLEPAMALKKEEFDVEILPVSKDGLVDPEQAVKRVRTDTILVSVMLANNEIGTIEPVQEIAKQIAKKRKNGFPIVHTDACQAAGFLPLDVRKLGVDLLTVNGGKIYGPKGVGFLYHRRGVKLDSIIHGGGQEGGVRSGTENVPLIVGMAKSFELAQTEGVKSGKKLSALRDELFKGILEVIPGSFLNGHPVDRLPNNINVCIPGIEGETLVLYLDEAGIVCSTGSACTAGSLDPSHVLRAIGLSSSQAKSSLRLTLGRENTSDEVKYFLKSLPGIVKKLRTL